MGLFTEFDFLRTVSSRNAIFITKKTMCKSNHNYAQRLRKSVVIFLPVAMVTFAVNVMMIGMENAFRFRNLLLWLAVWTVGITLYPFIMKNKSL